MKINNKRYLWFIIAVIILVIGITVGVYADNNQESIKAEGSFSNPIADRISISVDNTNFTIIKSNDSRETFDLFFDLSVKKTQPDFYVKINSIEMKDISYDKILFTSLNKDTDGKIPDDLLLEGHNGECKELKWNCDITLSFSGKGTFHPNLIIEYTSGVTKETSIKKQMTIPFIITVK